MLRADRDGRSFYAAVAAAARALQRGAARRGSASLLERRAGASYVDDRVSFLEEGTRRAPLLLHARGRARAVPTRDRGARGRDRGRSTARWEDRFLDALIARCGEADGPRARRALRARVPRGAARRHAPDRRACATSSALEALARGGRAAVRALLRSRRRPTRPRRRRCASTWREPLAALGPAAGRRPLRHPRRRRAADASVAPRDRAARGDRDAARAAARRRRRPISTRSRRASRDALARRARGATSRTTR